jgi:hypothetical protein
VTRATRIGTVVSAVRPEARFRMGIRTVADLRQTVRGYEAAGVQAIQLEDQEMPKKCGHTPKRRVVPMADMVRRLDVALDARTSPDFQVIPDRCAACTGPASPRPARAGRGVFFASCFDRAGFYGPRPEPSA